MEYILLIIGFVFLIKGADLFVGGASSIARYFKMPPILIGLTIVAFGTSAPEAAVSISAGLSGANNIALGNVIGSNIFNFLLVIGIASIINPLKIQKLTIVKEFPFLVLATAVLFVLAGDSMFEGFTDNYISRSDGLVLLLLFFVFIYYLVEMALLTKEDYKEESSADSITVSALKSVVGVAAIIMGSNWAVSSSSEIAISFGMSESLVGLTIVAIGTSLPELVTSIVAALKKENDIAMGNVIGSNMFNIFFVLGISSVINPIRVDSQINVDMIFLLVITLLTYIFSVTKRKVTRFEGVSLSVMYIIYLTFIIIRN